ncbi:MAG: gamma-glutamyl-phosphate reductase, partial [Clostridia bacterium]|nr:gamma-glutamyl-phosphate reductase [Clostridia bacterium]
MENIQDVCCKVRNATYKLSLYDTKAKNNILMAVADKIEQNKDNIKKINAIDIENAKGKLSEAMIDRLTLTDSRIALMAEGVRQVADLDDPVGKVVR